MCSYRFQETLHSVISPIAPHLYCRPPRRPRPMSRTLTSMAHFFTAVNPNHACVLCPWPLLLTGAIEQEWQHIARHLEIADVVRLAATCTTLNRAMHALPPLADRSLCAAGDDASPVVHTIPDSRVPKEAVGAITAGWSRLRFGYTCRSSVSGTFWSAREKDFKQVRGALSPRGGSSKCATPNTCHRRSRTCQL